MEERFASSHAVTVTTIILSRKRPQYIKTLCTHNYAHLGAVAVAAGVEHSPAGAARRGLLAEVRVERLLLSHPGPGT